MVMILLICKLVVNIHEQYARVMHVIIRDVVPQHCGIIGIMPLLLVNVAYIAFENDQA